MSQSRWTQSKFVTPVIQMEYMTRFAISPNKKNTIGFHAIPSRDGAPMQTPAQLGTFQSGGCVRMLKDNAIFIFNWATVGTKVVVLP
jgi:lipoprotein-anchoring transpeptidase ErfK/SrfK